MSTFHNFDRTGVPPHIAYNLLKEALREESKRSIFATRMDYTVTELATQLIDDEGNSILKEETEQHPLPSSKPPIDQQLAQAKKQKVKQSKLEVGLLLALKYLGREIIEELQNSPRTENHIEPIDVVHQSLQ